MTFENPLALWFLLAIPAIAIFHFYRVERITRRISTLAFWPTSAHYRGAPRAALQRLRPSWMLLLQLLGLATLIGALANPSWPVRASGSERVVFILDDSPSMQATDEPPNRFAAAKQSLLDALNDLGPHQEVMLLTPGRGVLVPFSPSRDRIEAAVKDATVYAQPISIERTRALATLLASVPGADVHTFSDGGIASISNPERTVWHRVGGDADNIGITALSIRAQPDRASQFDIYLRVHNFGAKDAEVPLTVRFDDQVLAESVVDIAGDSATSVVFPLRSKAGGDVIATIDTEDAFRLDDEAGLALAAVRTRRIALVGAGNPFLIEALRADRLTEVETIAPDRIFDPSAFDLVIFDRVPTPPSTDRPTLFIATAPSPGPLSIVGEHELPTPTDWRDDHPVTRYVDFRGVLIKQSLAVDPPATGHTLVESNGHPLIHVWGDDAQRRVFIGFDVFDSDLRARVGFPVLVQNVVNWLGNAKPPDAEHAQVVGAEESELRTSAVPNPSGGTHTTAGQSRSGWRWLVLIGLGLLLIEGALFYRSLSASRRTLGRLATVATPHVIALLALVGALLLPETLRPSDRLHVTALLDHSASFPTRDLAQLIGSATDAMGEDDELSLIAFAGTPASVPLPNEDVETDSPPVLSRDDTDIESAIRLALAEGPADSAHRIVLVTDGNETRGDSRRAAEEAARLGVPIDHLTPLSVSRPEVQLQQIKVPNEVRDGETYEVRVVINSNLRTTAQLALSRDDRLVANRSVELTIGNNVFAYTHHAEREGYRAYRASITSANDTFEENNSALGIIAVHEPARVLALDAVPSESRQFLDAMAAHGIIVDVKGPDDVSDAL
ncbi:MAG: VWA domain-containing protein, partial [Pseudomonadota bacterium]